MIDGMDQKRPQLIRKLNWTFDEFIKPSFEKVVKTHSYTMCVFDVWVTRLFNKESRVQCANWGAIVDKVSCTVTYTILLAYVKPDLQTIEVAKTFVWVYDFKNHEVIWSKKVKQ